MTDTTQPEKTAQALNWIKCDEAVAREQAEKIGSKLPKARVEIYETIRQALSTALTRKGEGHDSEWFFRWIARGKAGYAGMTYEQCADMIWHSPENPYRENNPWQDSNAAQTQDSGNEGVDVEEDIPLFCAMPEWLKTLDYQRDLAIVWMVAKGSKDYDETIGDRIERVQQLILELKKKADTAPTPRPAQVDEMLESARKTVAPIVAKEREAEKIDGDLMTFRMDAAQTQDSGRKARSRATNEGVDEHCGYEECCGPTTQKE